MAADTGLVLDRREPIDLRDVLRNVALAAELVFVRDFQHREPIDRRIIFCRRRIVGRGNRGEIDVLARRGIGFGGIDQAIAAHPDLIFCLRQAGHDIAALVVGDDDLGKTRRQIVRLGDHPDSGFRTLRPGDDAADIVIVDLDGIWRRGALRQGIMRVELRRYRRPERGQSQRRGMAKQCPLHTILPIFRDAGSPACRQFLRENLAPVLAHPQGPTRVGGQALA